MSPYPDAPNYVTDVWAYITLDVTIYNWIMLIYLWVDAHIPVSGSYDIFIGSPQKPGTNLIIALVLWYVAYSCMVYEL